MKLLLAAILVVETAILGVLITHHDREPAPKCQEAPIVHGPWEKYQK